METPLPVNGVQTLVDGVKYEIMTTISKDASGNISFSSDSTGGGAGGFGAPAAMPVYSGSMWWLWS